MEYKMTKQEIELQLKSTAFENRPILKWELSYIRPTKYIVTFKDGEQTNVTNIYYDQN